MEVSVQLYAPSALPPGKGALYTLNKIQSGPQNRSRPFGEGKIFLPLPWLESQTVQPVA